MGRIEKRIFFGVLWAENDKTKGVPKQGIPDYTCKKGESL